MGSTRLGSTLVALTLVASARALGLEAAAEPPSPGELALLLTRSFSQAELDKCRAALAGPSAVSRATAARVARLAGKPELLPQLQAALSTETDLGAAREEITAMGWLGGPSLSESLFVAAARFEGSLDRDLMASLAQRGPSALALVPGLRDRKLSESAWETFFDWATRGGREELGTAAEAAWATGSHESWGGVLAVSANMDRPLADATTARAIREGTPKLREKTRWYLLKQRGRQRTLGPETSAALAAPRETSGAARDEPTAQLATELLDRSLGRPPVDLSALLRGLSRSSAAQVPLDGSTLSLLRAEEREAVAEARFGDPKRLVAQPRDLPDPRSTRKGLLADNRIRTASDFPRGVIADVLAKSGCTLPVDPGWTGLEVHFDPQGSINRILQLPMRGPEACAPAARAMLLLAALPTDQPPRPASTDLILLPLWRDFAACVDAPRRPPHRTDEQAQTGGTIREPKKLKNVPPQYPQRAKQEARSGTIVLDTTISPDGCVFEAEVVAGEHLDLAAEALRSVVQWRYTPTLLNGVPVPVIMTVTVNFRLN